MAPHFQSMRYDIDVDAKFGVPTNKSHMTLHSLTRPHSHHLYSPFSIYYPLRYCSSHARLWEIGMVNVLLIDVIFFDVIGNQ